MRIHHLAAALCAALFSACIALTTNAAPSLSNDELKKQVADTERAFAATMKARDHAAFVSFLSDETIFYGGKEPLVGKEAVAAKWKAYYEQKDAQFSWEPDQVDVLASGTLASSSGPVYDANGKLLSRFASIWRLEAPGKWKIVFDRGAPVSNCKKE